MTDPTPAAPIYESDVLSEVLLAVGARRDCRVWRANTGAARTASGRLVRFGIRGQADILGLTSTGRFLAIECKSPTGRLSPAQIGFCDMVERFGGIYIVARSAQDAFDQLDAILLGAHR